MDILNVKQTCPWQNLAWFTTYEVWLLNKETDAVIKF